MRMKMFSAETVDAAKALIFAEMGDDAVILSEREVDGRVEIRAATDKSGRAEPFALRNRDSDPRFDNPLRHRVRDTLGWHGSPKRFAERISAASIDLGTDDPCDALAGGLESQLSFDPIAAIPENDIVLVGPPGHGRTSTAAKLTRRAAVANGEIHPVAADLDAAAGGAQLAAYLEREQNQIRVAETPEALFSTLRDIRASSGRFVIDLPAIAPFEADDMASLVDLVAAIHAEPILVLSAEGHPEDQADTVRAFAKAGVKRAILTKLDIARRRGGAVSALAEAGVALSHLAVTPFIGGGLVPAAPQRLASLLMEDAPGRTVLKGAA
ncbi:MAG: flagellar biosynthesis protein FlhF-like protein [Pseudomonadota bacterium]